MSTPLFPFLFLRHGESDWNRALRTQGQEDRPLTPLGITQAEQAARRLQTEPVRQIIASPLSRALRTAEIVGAALGLPVATEPALMEAHMGDLQGEPHGPRNAAYWRGEDAPAGGESFDVFCDRVVPAVQAVAAIGPGVLVVAHGGLWTALRARVAIAPDFAMPNGVPIRVTPGEAGWAAEPLLPLPDQILVSEGAAP